MVSKLLCLGTLLGMVLLGSFGFSRADDFKPGHKGSIPVDPQKTPVPPARKIVDNSNRDNLEIPPPENTLKCGEPFQVAVVVKQKVESCEALKSFAPLLKQAFSDLEDNLYKIKCPVKGCRNRYTWYSKAIFTCENNVAMVKLKENVKCLKEEGDTTPPYIDTPLGLDPTQPVTTGPDTNDFTQAYNREYIEDDFVQPAAVSFGLSCPSSILVSFTYDERGAFVPGIKASVRGYDDIVQRAEQKAEQYFDSYGCEVGCEKQKPFKPAYVGWNIVQIANEDYFEVIIYFWVNCPKKP